MKLITRDTDYAIRALCYIAKNKKGLVTVSELVKELKMPRPFLRKILQVLNKKGLLTSYKGKAGGFNLRLAPEKILLLDIIKVFQGPWKLSEHKFKNGICPHTKKCGLKKKLDDIERYVIKKLEGITIGCLIRER